MSMDLNDYKQAQQLKDVAKQLVTDQLEDIAPERVDSLINFAFGKVVTGVAIYCNIEIDEIPDALLFTMASMIADGVTSALVSYAVGELGESQAQSISEGDVSVTFRDPLAMTKAVREFTYITDDYKAVLNHYRKLKWY